METFSASALQEHRGVPPIRGNIFFFIKGGVTPPTGSPLLLQCISPNPPVLDPALLPLQKPHSVLGVNRGLPWGPPAPPRGLQLQEEDMGPKSLTNKTLIFDEVQGQVI